MFKLKMLFKFQKSVSMLLSMTSQWHFNKQQFIPFTNYHQIIVLLKQSPAAYRIYLLAGQCTSIHCTQCTELAVGQLSRFNHKGQVISKFAEYKPNGLPRVECSVGGSLQA